MDLFSIEDVIICELRSFNSLEIGYSRFFQHVPNRVEWDWGLQWGHVVSQDLVYWERLPNALIPTEGFYDSDGCFSGK